jgi:DNA polymerase-3 subunit gamma/tau
LDGKSKHPPLPISPSCSTLAAHINSLLKSRMSTKKAASVTLNLARKWRSRTFDEIVGQEMAVSMLRNSLYKNHFFPVYLFAGQKGCGKTSSARILAAAANCEQLTPFQTDPSKTSVPCLKCQSCSSMYSGTHPDFIEIDAASHTGVDDVRALLESCSFMPLMGSKKVYLIDEAHMLSKAAFNAFLKVLEEPPAQVMFMMATTELHKIPETVRSRCFQLHFNAIDPTLLHTHLTKICEEEKIACAADALTLILQETDGSARDAINLLEQVRFANETISAEDVRRALGIMSPHRLTELLALMVENKPAEMLGQLEKISFQSLNPTRLWQLLLNVVRTLIWHTYGITSAQHRVDIADDIRERILGHASRNRLQSILQLLWEQEELFLATPYKHAFLEKLFLDVCEQLNIKALDELTALLKSEGAAPASSPRHPGQAQRDPGQPKAASAPLPRAAAAQVRQQAQPTPLAQTATPQRAPQQKVAPPAPRPQPTLVQPQQRVAPPPPPASIPSLHAEASAKEGAWQQVCREVTTHNDPILQSIFQQARVRSVANGTVTISLPNVNPFFQNKIQDNVAIWQPILKKYYDNCTQLVMVARGATPEKKTVHKPAVNIPVPKSTPRPSPQQQQSQAPWQQRHAQKPKRYTPRVQGKPLLLTDETKDKWPSAHLLSTHFPGKLEILGDIL